MSWLGHKLRELLKPFVKQVTFSSREGSSGSGEEASADRERSENDPSEAPSLENNLPTISSAVGDGNCNSLVPDSGLVSTNGDDSDQSEGLNLPLPAEASLTEEYADVKENLSTSKQGTEQQNNSREEGIGESDDNDDSAMVLVMENGGLPESGGHHGDSCAVLPKVSLPKEPVRHSPSSSISSPSSSSASPTPSSTESESGDDQNQSLSSSSDTVAPQQESLLSGSKSRQDLNRLQILYNFIEKNPQISSSTMKLRIPTCAHRCFAKMKYILVPYRKEDTDWPNRHFQMNAKLTIPKKCTTALTVSSRCTVIISVNVSSTPSSDNKNDLLPNKQPVIWKGIVTPGGTSIMLVSGLKLVRHTTLIDASCTNVYVEVLAKFELHPMKYEVLEDGEVVATCE